MEEQKLEQAFRASDLIVKYLKGELTDKEQTELDSWIEQSDANRKLFSELTNPDLLNQQLDEFYKVDMDAAHRRLQKRLFPHGTGVLRFIPTVWRYVAAAVIAVLVGAGIWQYTGGSQKQEVAIAPLPEAPAIGPGEKKARLVMEDGQVVDLETQKDSSFESGQALVTNSKEGLLTYRNSETAEGISRHTMIVPRGSEYHIELQDGTRVWLNAASTLSYPTKFTGNERKVTLTGEGYFKVAENKAKPFHVSVNDMDVMVTGTEFNINAYSDESVVKSTLFSGGVKITQNSLSFDLKPGMELQIDDKGQVKIVENADLDAAIAWMNGIFNLENADIPTLMRAISRWYNIEVVYAQGVPQGRFSGQIPRSLEFPELLRVLNEGGIKTKIDGKKLIIY
ncbi:MAG TPA: FecR family protein [Chitinophagaceae bacterium]|nr:FecR family protein [Chitinophagaceae bacterium]